MENYATIGWVPVLLLFAIVITLMGVIFWSRFTGLFWFLCTEFTYLLFASLFWKSIGIELTVLILLVLTVLYFSSLFPTFPKPVQEFLKKLPRRLN
jgi:hypothetical protein